MISALDKRLALVIVLIGPIASLVVSPVWNYDPINPIKNLFISSAAFYVLGFIIVNSKLLSVRIPFRIRLALLFFLLALSSSFLFSGAPLNQQFWGSFGRNTGFLTYVSLLLIATAAAFTRIQNLIKLIINSLVITSIPMTFYCLIQVAKLDPIGWSEKLPFGTFGNINFSSAFFGLSSIVSIALLRDRSYSKLFRVFLLVLASIDLLIVISTGSIQGLMMFIAGIGVQGFLLIRERIKSSTIQFLYFLVGIFATVLTIFGLSNKGPLAKYLFAPSIVFRTDYWHAGWAMTLKFPFFGVGLDSYGDWYRTLRGEISTLRTGPDRIANTAHNIFLDLSSNGGFPLISAYLLILIFAFFNGIKLIRNKPNAQNVALFTAWLGYLIFSAISIGQVGVGIWGWLFTGLLLGSNENNNTDLSKGILLENRDLKTKRKITKSKSISPLESIISVFCLALGFFLAFVPLNADARYKSAIQNSTLSDIMASANSIGATAFHKEMVVDLLIRNNLTDQARQVSLDLVKQYPRDFYGWKAISILKNSTEIERQDAIKKLRQLDPYNTSLG